MSRRAWSADDDATALALRGEGKKPDFIARKLNRTPAAVATRLHKLRAEAGQHQRRGSRSVKFKPTNPSAIDAFLRKPVPCR